MSEAVIAGTAPLPLDVEAGKTYFWCSCGRSQKQPLCDGSHNAQECAFEPQAWTAPTTRTVFFCTCKRTANAPLCDGSHGAL